MVQSALRPSLRRVVGTVRHLVDDPGLNRRQAVELCHQYMLLIAVLRMNGIPVLPIRRQPEGGTKATNPARRYYVYLFQSQVLKLMKAERPTVWLNQELASGERFLFSPSTTHPDDPERKQVERLAIRSLYAAGLDYGAVYLGADSPHRVRVLDVHPLPRGDVQMLMPLYAQTYQAYRDRLAQEEAEQREVVLGADPEYALRDSCGNLGVASRFLPKHGTVGCDAARLQAKPLSGQLPLVELRPAPSADPDQLFRNIRGALHKAAQLITDRSLEWIAGGMPFVGYPLGGHIHFSGVPFSFSLLRALDSYLTLPLALVEDPGCRQRRPRYGFLGDYRIQPHGGFEYRTPPSWLVTPLIARGVLSLAKLIATHYRKLPAHPLLDPQIQRAYYTGDTARLRPVVEQLWTDLQRLPQYNRYHRAIHPLFVYVLSGAVWPADQDFRAAWDLPVSFNNQLVACYNGGRDWTT